MECLCVEGMSETPCDNKVQIDEYLSSDDLSKLYVREGPAAGISNTYTKSGDSFQIVDAANQGNCPIGGSIYRKCRRYRYIGIVSAF